ncbi:DUF5683 domain-containing protein [Winogradskyella immobilis]|uniref:DUF5683 domain-containing protein n=1 Tax=Winogradskyella immobilis TaxID=2816852 RepID=A0ABS8ERL5_9FLAO|nr:DUF5683 domain-containing protein [Winogradskyella immobilis]MCC1484947.1 hypothetical protein [Winogradskyella immobilis]MCG0017039.1 DUF5683 domain-containing protein [Winogradskyella immobilis]
MLNKHYFITIVCCLLCVISFSQERKDSTVVTNEDLKISNLSVTRKPIDPLSPAKAAFYSAVLPGLGQAYNKKYWKIPIVYAALGTGVYFYITNDNELDRFRDAFKRRRAGFNDDEFQNISDDGLIRAQRQFRRNKEISLFVTIGIYALNIIDANIDAHLLQFNVDENLSFKPHFQYNRMEHSSDLGLTFNYTF